MCSSDLVVRKALGESPKDHRFIVTVPGRGYRFAAEVHEPLPVHESSQACQLYLKGRHFLNKRLTPSLHQAITCFRQSTDEDPTYAPAWVGLADAYALHDRDIVARYDLSPAAGGS